jgi:hypothetical protein
MRYNSITGGEGLHYPTKTMTDTFNPQIGDLCNWRIWTDVEPCTVVARTPKTVTVRVNKTVIAKAPEMEPCGFAGVVTEPAKWHILDEMEQRTHTFTLRASGAWKMQGTSLNSSGNVLRPGHYKFYDYGF